MLRSLLVVGLTIWLLSPRSVRAPPEPQSTDATSEVAGTAGAIVLPLPIGIAPANVAESWSAGCCTRSRKRINRPIRDNSARATSLRGRQSLANISDTPTCPGAPGPRTKSADGCGGELPAPERATVAGQRQPTTAANHSHRGGQLSPDKGCRRRRRITRTGVAIAHPRRLPSKQSLAGSAAQPAQPATLRGAARPSWADALRARACAGRDVRCLGLWPDDPSTIRVDRRRVCIDPAGDLATPAGTATALT